MISVNFGKEKKEKAAKRLKLRLRALDFKNELNYHEPISN